MFCGEVKNMSLVEAVEKSLFRVVVFHLSFLKKIMGGEAHDI